MSRRVPGRAGLELVALCVGGAVLLPSASAVCCQASAAATRAPRTRPRRAPGLPRSHQRGRRTTMEPAQLIQLRQRAAPRRPSCRSSSTSSASSGGRPSPDAVRRGSGGAGLDQALGPRGTRSGPSSPAPSPRAAACAFCEGFELPASITKHPKQNGRTSSPCCPGDSGG